MNSNNKFSFFFIEGIDAGSNVSWEKKRNQIFWSVVPFLAAVDNMWRFHLSNTDRIDY